MLNFNLGSSAVSKINGVKEYHPIMPSHHQVSCTLSWGSHLLWVGECLSGDHPLALLCYNSLALRDPPLQLGTYRESLGGCRLLFLLICEKNKSAHFLCIKKCLLYALCSAGKPRDQPFLQSFLVICSAAFLEAWNLSSPGSTVPAHWSVTLSWYMW